jgi:hypothetical protein
MKTFIIIALLFSISSAEPITKKQDRLTQIFNRQYDSLYKFHSFHSADSVSAVRRMKRTQVLISKQK